MSNGERAGALILVLEDIEETRDGIEQLLKADGYRVDPARDEEDAVTRAMREPPCLMLVSLVGADADIIQIAARVRLRAGLMEDIPVVIFCSLTIAEGAEVEIGRNIYVTRPDNFDQLRLFLCRLLALSLTPQS